MERLLQYMDDFDDLLGAVGLTYESIRRFALRLLALACGAFALAGGFILALNYPLAALGVGVLLLLVLAYRTLAVLPRRTLRSV